jgi:hypothetical protein
MSNESASLETTFGYLSIIETDQHGYFGGYLIVSPIGRPLEFHCTAPVQPSRAQKILYGATLEPYLLGEQIGGALLGVAKLAPELVLTNHEATLQLRTRSGMTLAQFCGNADIADCADRETVPEQRLVASTATGWQAVRSRSAHEAFTVGGYRFRLAMEHVSKRESVARLLGDLAQRIDLVEPFNRIAEAIREAQRLGDGGGEVHDQAA